MRTRYMTAQEATDEALKRCRGEYQRDIVLGRASLSGADLKGKAKDFGGRYAESRKTILGRLGGLPIIETKLATGKRVLLAGTAAHLVVVAGERLNDPDWLARRPIAIRIAEVANAIETLSLDGHEHEARALAAVALSGIRRLRVEHDEWVAKARTLNRLRTAS